MLPALHAVHTLYVLLKILVTHLAALGVGSDEDLLGNILHITYYMYFIKQINYIYILCNTNRRTGGRVRRGLAQQHITYIFNKYLYIIYYIAALGVGSDEDLRVGAEVAAHDGEDAAAAELVGLDGHQRHDDGRICDVNGRLHDRKCNYNCIHSCNYD